MKQSKAKLLKAEAIIKGLRSDVKSLKSVVNELVELIEDSNLTGNDYLLQRAMDLL